MTTQSMKAFLYSIIHHYSPFQLFLTLQGKFISLKRNKEYIGHTKTKILTFWSSLAKKIKSQIDDNAFKSAIYRKTLESHTKKDSN